MSAEERMASYDNGIGVMLAKERTAAGIKGYDNGIGVMSAEERTAAGQKGYENGIAKGRHDKWEEQYAKFKDYDGMPVDGSKLSNWQRN